MTRTRTLGAALIAVAALVAAGCGGSDEEEATLPAATVWADDLCTAISTWRESIEDATSALAGNHSSEGLEDAADTAKEATETLADTVEGLGSPGTESGDEARSALDSLGSTVESNVDQIEDAVQDVSGIAGVLDAAGTVSDSLTEISTEVSDTVQELQGLEDSDDELRQSFEDADSCDGVVSDSS